MDITVAIPAHPARVRNGMLNRALISVADQTLPAAAVAVAVDLNREGAPATRQRALEMARTDWVAFLDSDDYFLPEHLQTLADHAEATGADLAYSWFKVLAENGTILEHDPVFPPGHYLNPFDPENPIETTITTLVRTDLARQVGFKTIDRGHALNTGEDRRLILELLALGAHISHAVARTWVWSHHGGNTSGHPTRGDAA